MNKEKLKILLFSKHFWPENFRINLVIKYISQISSVVVFSENPSYYTSTKINKNSRIFKKINITRLITFPRIQGSLISIALNYFTYCFFGILKIIFWPPKKADIVLVYATSPIFQAIPAIVYCKLYKIPLIIWVQDLWPDVIQDLNLIKNKFIVNVLKKFVSYIYNSSDCLFAQSASFKKEIKKYTKKKIIIVFNPEEKKDFKYTNTKKTEIVFGGNLGHGQSLETLVEALKKIESGIVIKIYGNGSKKLYLQQAIKKNNLEKLCKIYNSITPKKFSKILNNSSASLILLKKGSALSKTLPAKFQTYLSIGKPIIASGGKELNNFIKKNGVGFCCTAEDANALANCINKIKTLSTKQKIKIYNNSKKIFNDRFEISAWTHRVLSYIKIVLVNYNRIK
jgi:glycosyltransferase involved in cell wall biosynthesis